MELSYLVDRYDLLLTPKFLDSATWQQVIREARVGDCNPATVYGDSDVGSIHSRVRKTSQLKLPETTIRFVMDRLVEHKKTIEEHFCISLNYAEEPQFQRW
jgi:predicted 2-oxoglutarate/Fe(II)-dependent dioxygenase YbiX